MSRELDVLVPSFNCGEWIDRCLKSISIQTVQPTRVLVIDDASTEPGYAEHVAKLCAKNKYMFLRNDVNQRCPLNLWVGVQLLDTSPNGVVFLLDGDDFLPHANVFSRIAEVYQDDEVWLTYGNYEPHPHNTGQQKAMPYPENVIRDREFRRYPAGFNHPITFRRHLWDRLMPADLQNRQGQWFKAGYDLVIMMPMLELSSPNHFRFLDETLYAYNAVNPLSEVPAGHAMDVEESREILSRPKRTP